jgi:hypothetical protein
VKEEGTWVVVLAGATVFANAAEAGRKAEDWAEASGSVMSVSNEAEGAECKGHVAAGAVMSVSNEVEGAQGEAPVYEEILVFDSPEMRLVLTVLRKTVDPAVGGGGATTPFWAETKTKGT